MAIYLMGLCFANGVGVTKDVSQAVDYFRQAAAAGLPAAMYLDAASLTRGDGIRPNAQEGGIWMERAAKAGEPMAMAMHGYNIALRKRDTSGAVAWWEKAARLGNPNAVAFLRHAAGGGVREAQDALGRLARDRVPIDENLVRQALAQLQAASANQSR